jgi:hypothetical protein
MHLGTLRLFPLPAVLETGLSSLLAVAIFALPSVALAQDAQPSAESVDQHPAFASPPVAPAAPAGPASAEEPSTSAAPHAYVRHGFTMELGLGISQTSVSSQVGEREHSGIGLAPLSLGLGGFLSPRLAIIGRAAGTSTFRDDAKGSSYQTVNGFYGPTLQYWVTDRFYLGGGPGLALLGADPLGDRKRDIHFLEAGFGLNARAGFAFALPGDHHALVLGIDAFGSKFAQSNTLAVALNLGWQFY